jgi:hypothetical protein
MKDNYFYCYVKDVWSKDFSSFVDNILKVKSFTPIIREDNKILFRINENYLDDAEKILIKNVKEGAWHDLVNKDEIIIIFGPNDIERIPLSVPFDNKIWLRMKELEPSIRKYNNIKDMILSSKYATYIYD